MDKPTPSKLRDIKESLIRQRSGLTAEQTEDQSYFDDEFATRIKKPYIERRTGTSSEIVLTGAKFITTTNPKVFRDPRSTATAEVERADKIARLGNYWVDLLTPQIRESVFDGIQRGEAFWEIQLNRYKDEEGVEKTNPNMPLRIEVPDPMIIFPSLGESQDGIPECVVKSCRMSVSQVQLLYPGWDNPRGRKIGDMEGVDYWAYFNKNWRYFEADGVSLTNGIEPNALGFTPFVHLYSGLGKDSPDGKPESKVVGKLRHLRNSLRMECELISMIDSIIALYANPVLFLWSDDPNVVISEADRKSITFRPGAVNILKPGWKKDVYMPNLPLEPLFQHYYQVRARLQSEMPPVALGMPSTSRSTGRQEDIYQEVYGKQYAVLIHNICRGIATVLGLGLRMLDTPAFGLLPMTNRLTMWKDGQQVRNEEKIEKSDIGGYYDLDVRLDPDEAIEASRNAMLYKGYWESGLVDKKTVLMEGLKKTNDEADKIINKRIADDYIMTNPVMGEAISRKAVELSGMGDILRQMDMQMAAQGAQGAKGPRPSEAQSVDSDVIKQILQEQPYGARESPELEGI